MLRIAEKLAKRATARKQRHSCLILKGGRLIAQANNESGHAERIALKCMVFHYGIDDQSEGKFKGATLLSFRIKPNGTIGKSKPCPYCEKAIAATGIRKVIYFDGTIWQEEYK